MGPGEGECPIVDSHQSGDSSDWSITNETFQIKTETTLHDNIRACSHPASPAPSTPESAPWRLQHGYALGSTVEVRGRAAPSGGLEALGGPAPQRHPAPGPRAHDDPGAVVVVVVEVVALLQHGHHRVAGDGAELVGKGAVEDQDVHREDPLADGGGVLQDEALVDEEDAA